MRSGRLCSGRVVAVTELLATGREGRHGSNAGDDLEGRGGASKEQLEERQQVAETADCLRPQGRTLTAELCRERPPRAEQQHLDRGGRRSEPLGDLTVREAVPLAEEDRAALRLRDARQGVVEPEDSGQGPNPADAGTVGVGDAPLDNGVTVIDAFHPVDSGVDALLDRDPRQRPLRAAEDMPPGPSTAREHGRSVAGWLV